MNSNNDAAEVAERAVRFFEGMSASGVLKDVLLESDHCAQFIPMSGKPFHVKVVQGQLVCGAGTAYTEDMAECIYAIEIRPCFDAIFRGEELFGESIFDMNIRIPGYRNKEPEIARFSRLLRMGVWAQIPGARILKPVR